MGASPADRPALPWILAGLCLTQITAWGVLYYAFPVLSARITAETGWSATATTAAYSAALMLSALIGIRVGKVLDRHGPRWIMTTGSLLGVLGVLVLAWSPSYGTFLVGWLIIGAAQAGTLYPPAFAAVTRWYGTRRVFALTVITLVGGLASTVFAPTAEALAGVLSWREVWVVLAVVLGVVTVPIHLWVLRRPWPQEAGSGPVRPEGGEEDVPRSTEGTAPAQDEPRNGTEDQAGWVPEEAYARGIMRSPAYLLMTVGLTLGSMAMFAAMINLVPMLVARGVDSTTAAWILGIGGAGQVLGRLFYWAMERWLSVRLRTTLIYGLVAAGSAAFALDQTHLAWLLTVAVLTGMGRGLSTLLKATAVTDRWGPRAYGRLSGVFNAPVMLGIALAPVIGAGLADLLASWQAAYVVLAVIGALGVGALHFSVPRPAKGTS